MNKETVAQLLKSLAIDVETGGYDEQMTEALKTLLEKTENYKSIDKDMVQTLQNYLGDNLVKKDAYNGLLLKIKQY